MLPLLRYIVVAVVVLGFSSYAYGQSSSLSCDEVRRLVGELTEKHLSQDEFNDEISQRVLEKVIEHWDGRKHFFLKKDIEGFYKEYGSSLDDHILEGDCSPIAKIVDVYSQRFVERMKRVPSLIELEHDFSLEEILYLDPDHYDFSPSAADLGERWRKWVKYQHMQLLRGRTDKEVREKLAKRYELRKKRFDETTLSDVYSEFVKSFAASLDPHSDYMPAQEFKNFQISMSLSLEGIGVSITSEDGFAKIIRVLPAGAAYRHGVLQAGDKIIGVAQEEGEWVNVVDLDLDDVVQLIRGPRGSRVLLLVLREGLEGVQKFEVEIERDQISMEEQAVQAYHYTVHDVLHDRTFKIGVAYVPSFYADHMGRMQKKKDYRSVSGDLERALKQLSSAGIEALVVDLRNNGGGLLGEAVHLSSLFLPKAVVVQTKAKSSKPKTLRSEGGKVAYDGPLVVLTNLASASASEIFVGAIKDHERGVVVGVGERTFGKGTVQELVNVESGDGSRLKVTVSRFYTPAGYSTQLKGVAADLVLPSWLEEREIGEQYRKYAVPWNKINSAPLKNLARVSGGIIRRLGFYHKERRQRDRDFYSVQEMMQYFKENKKPGTPISLKMFRGTEESSTDESPESSESLGSATTKVERKPPQPRKDKKQDPSLAIPSLADDVYLREAVYVAADYLQILAKKPSGVHYQALSHGSTKEERGADQVRDISGCSAVKGFWHLGC